MKPPVNLATRPFRNERLPALAFGLAVVALVGLTAAHALALRRLLPDRTSALHQRVRALEREVATLRAGVQELRGSVPDAASVAKWTQLKELVDRRSFGWSDLFGRLEAVVPRGVRLVSIEPAWSQGRLELRLAAVTRTAEDGFDFARALEEQDSFEEVYPVSKSTRSAGELEFRYVMRYEPRVVTAAAAPAAPDAGDGADEEAGAGGQETRAPGPKLQPAVPRSLPARPPIVVAPAESTIETQ